jgi:hypothetical protein
MGQIIVQGSGTDLTVLEKLTPADLFAEGGTEPVYEAISKEVSTFVPDVTTESGRKEIASLAYKIAQSKNFLDKVGKAFNSDLKEKTKAVDKERAAIWDKLEALQKKISKPLDDYKAAEEARVQAHKDAMAELEKLHIFMPTDLANIEKAIARAGELKRRDWQEFTEMAAPVFEQQWVALMGMKVSAEQAERDRAELEELRRLKAEQEAKAAEQARQKAADEERQRIEHEAQEKAQRDAAAAIKAAEELAAKQKADAEAKAIADAAEAERRIKEAEEAKIAAEARAKLEAEQAVQRERERAAAEQKRLDDEAKARENDRAHHAKINNEVMAALAALDCVLGEVPAKAITIAIAEGKIPHVKISY